MAFLKNKYKKVMVTLPLTPSLKKSDNIYYENYHYNSYIGYAFLTNLIIWLKLQFWFFSQHFIYSLSKSILKKIGLIGLNKLILKSCFY